MKNKKTKQVCFRSSKGSSDTSAPCGFARFFIVLGAKIHEPLVSPDLVFPVMLLHAAVVRSHTQTPPQKLCRVSAAK